MAQPAGERGLEHRNIVNNLARCQNPVRDGGDGRRLDVELDFRLWRCRASGFRVRVAAELVKPVSCGYWIELDVVRPGVRRSRIVMRRCTGPTRPPRCGTTRSPAEPLASVVRDEIIAFTRPEERRVGKKVFMTCRYRGST